MLSPKNCIFDNQDANSACIAARRPLFDALKSTDEVGFPHGLVPCPVHSLFKEYHSCARSFSPLPPLALLSLSRPARKRLLTTPLLPLRTPLPPPPTPLRTPLLSPPTPLRAPLTPPPLALLTPLRALLTLLRLLPVPLRTPLPPLATLPRRCNLRFGENCFSKIGARKGNLARPFLWAAFPLRTGEGLRRLSSVCARQAPHALGAAGQVPRPAQAAAIGAQGYVGSQRGRRRFIKRGIAALGLADARPGFQRRVFT